MCWRQSHQTILQYMQIFNLINIFTVIGTPSKPTAILGIKAWMKKQFYIGPLMTISQSGSQARQFLAHYTAIIYEFLWTSLKTNYNKRYSQVCYTPIPGGVLCTECRVRVKGLAYACRVYRPYCFITQLYKQEKTRLTLSSYSNYYKSYIE